MSFGMPVQDNDESKGSATEASTPTWWLDENTPGVGERPDWLPNKYKSAKDVAKAYGELEKRLGVAPQEYSLDSAKEWLDPEFEPLKDFLGLAKSKHVPQEVIDGFGSVMGKYLDQFKPDMEAEKAKLGEKVQERIDRLNNWVQSNFSKEAVAALTENLRTAEAVKALEEVREKMLGNSTRIPTGNESNESGLTLEAVQQELKDNLQKYQDDPGYRKQIQAKLAQVAQQSDYVDKIYS